MSMTTASSVVGFATQPEVMRLHRGRAHHPEKPERLTTILERLRDAGLLSCCHDLSNKRAATDDELLAVHTAAHIANVSKCTRAVRENPGDTRLREPQGDGAIYYNEETEQAARSAVGSVLEALHATVRGEVRSAFALVRPPGHHAEADEALGFCFFNSAAVAAAVALREHAHVERVAIVDWDVHHGNGTQHIFEADPNVLFVSLHRFGRGFFPGTGAVGEVGEAAGRGRTLNVPWMQAGLGDADYVAAFELVVMPVLREFAPQVLLISAGFDAALGDVQGKMRMSPGGFAHLTRRLLALPACAPVAIFEGGYHLEVSADCTEAVLRAMLEEAASCGSGGSGGSGGCGGSGSAHGEGSASVSLGAQPSASKERGGGSSLGTHTELLLRQVVDAQREFWHCFREPSHALAVEEYFRGASRRKRGRS